MLERVRLDGSGQRDPRSDPEDPDPDSDGQDDQSDPGGDSDVHPDPAREPDDSGV